MKSFCNPHFEYPRYAFCQRQVSGLGWWRGTSTVVLVTACLLVAASVAFAAEPAPPANASAAQFEEWVKASRMAVEKVRGRPEFAEVVLQRLRDGKSFSDETILTTATAWSYFDQVDAQAHAKPGEAHYTFENTLAFIKEVSPYAEGRPFLQAQLLLKRAFCHATAGKLDQAVADRREAVPILEKLHLQIDQQRNTTLNELAEGLRATGKTGEAEKLFLEVMSYPWYNVVSNSEVLQTLRAQYVRAARGLIECRRGNLAALKEIFLVPATQEEVGPFLGKAIAEAQN